MTQEEVLAARCDTTAACHTEHRRDTPPAARVASYAPAGVAAGVSSTTTG
jgi:hypothetical protein